MYVEIIDDNTQLSNYVRKSFEKFWNTVGLYNSRDDFLHTSDFNADLYIMDINLWDGNGLDLIEHMRVLEKVTNPIIIVSGQSDPKIRREWLKIWADGFIEKPFTASELHEKIDDILHHIESVKKGTCEETNSHICSCLSQKEKSKVFQKK